MRLINCLVENVRVHSNLSIDFSPRITLIGGANETGKSSLIDALHLTLFLKATASGAPIEALKSKLYLGNPTVQIKFEVKEENYLLRKSFTGTNGQIMLLNEANGKQLSGSIAEEYLASLLGVKESLGSKQVKTILPSRWAHLWVMQGSSGNDLLKEDKSYYDFDLLLRQLEKKGGAAIQQSAQDQRVVKQIDREIESNFTSRSVKKNSALWQRQDEFDKSKQNLEITLSKLKEYEFASKDLIEITNNIEQINIIALPKLFERKKTISLKAEALKKLERDISLTEKDLKPIKLRHDFLKKSLLKIISLQEEIINKGKDHGIKVGDPLVKNNILVGKIFKTNFNSSHGILITNINSRIPVRIGKKNYKAIVVGNPKSEKQLNLEFLPKEYIFEDGDIIYTTNIENIMPDGILVGQIKLTNDGDFEAKPLYDFSQLDYLTVVRFAK